jgi:hypothetical protein
LDFRLVGAVVLLQVMLKAIAPDLLKAQCLISNLESRFSCCNDWSIVLKPPTIMRTLPEGYSKHFRLF